MNESILDRFLQPVRPFLLTHQLTPSFLPFWTVGIHSFIHSISTTLHSFNTNNQPTLLNPFLSYIYHITIHFYNAVHPQQHSHPRSHPPPSRPRRPSRFARRPLLRRPRPRRQLLQPAHQREPDAVNRRSQRECQFLSHLEWGVVVA